MSFSELKDYNSMSPFIVEMRGVLNIEGDVFSSIFFYYDLILTSIIIYFLILNLNRLKLKYRNFNIIEQFSKKKIVLQNINYFSFINNFNKQN